MGEHLSSFPEDDGPVTLPPADGPAPRPPIPCNNPTHTHAYVTGPKCFPIVDPDRPLPDRVLGTAVVVTVVALGALAVGAARLFEDAAEHARLRAAVRRWMREQEARRP